MWNWEVNEDKAMGPRVHLKLPLALGEETNIDRMRLK
jgi:hypothetical protein